MATRNSQTGDENVVWSDSPIDSPASDSYSFASFVERLAAFVGSTPKGSASTVFSLTGEWGSGKTSAVNLLKRKLQTAGYDGWSVVQFSPWATSDLNSMLIEFAQTIATARPGENRTSLQEKLASFVEKTSRVGALIPGTVGDTSKAVNELVRTLSGGKNWHHVLGELEQEIEEMDRQILVVVDDLDRLGSNELLAVLKLVRLLGRLSDVHYLLVYDQDVLNGILQTALPGSGEQWSGEYLEKFVQHGFRLPPLNEYQVLMKINQWLGEHPQFSELLKQDLRVDMFGEALFRLLRTPRKLHSFLHRLDFYDRNIDFGEVRADDLFFLTVLEISVTSVYVALWPMKMELVTGNAAYQTRHLGLDHHRELTAERLTESVPPLEATAVQRLLTRLFPELRLNRDAKRISVAPSPKSIAEADYFERYFMLDIPSGDISDSEVAEAVHCAASGNDRGLRKLLSGEVSVASLSIAKGLQLARTRSLVDTAKGEENLAAALIDIVSEMNFDRVGVIDPRASVFDWVEIHLAELEPAHSGLVVQAIGRASDEVQVMLGDLIATSSETGPLAPWREALVERRVDRVRGLLEMGAGDPVGFSFYRDFEFIREAGKEDFLLESIQIPLAPPKHLALRIATLFIDYTQMMGPGHIRDGAIFWRNEMERFAARLKLDESTRKALVSLRGRDGEVLAFKRDKSEEICWYSLATELTGSP